MKKFVSVVLALSLCAIAAVSCAEFRVHCLDASGNPVAGAKIQVCTDTNCMMKKSGADGDAVFPAGPDNYTIHAYKIPDGYGEPAEITTTPDDADATLVFPAPGAAAVPASLDDVDFSGAKAVVVYYFEPACADGLSAVETLYEADKDKGLLVVAVYSDENGADSALAAAGVTFPVVHAAEAADGTPKAEYYSADRTLLAAADPLPATAEDWEAAVAAYLN